MCHRSDSSVRPVSSFALSLIAFILVFAYNLHAAEILYVQSAKAKLMSDKNFKSDLKETLKRGDRLEALENSGGWYKVSAGTTKGWVHRLSVSTNPVMEKLTLISADAPDISRGARKRASAITSAAAARGLSDTDRKRLNEQGRADYRSLEKLEKDAGGISENEVEEFAK